MSNVYIVSDHVAWVFIVGFAGVGIALVLIAMEVQQCTTQVLRAIDDIRAGERPPGYKSVEYHPNGAVKRVETVPDDGKDV
jgi:hypothetical protein